MHKLITILIFLCFLSACGNPHITEDLPGDSLSGTTPVEPIPQTPNWPPPNPEEPPQHVLVEVTGQSAIDSDINQLNLVYSKVLKPIGLGETVKSKQCPKGHEHHCIKDRQVVFQFDLNSAQMPGNNYRIKEAILVGDFYSIGKNFRTELLCLLNTKTCSGRGIIKIPRLGLSFMVKMLWWNKKFWDRTYDETVVTTHFHDQLEKGFNQDEEIYILEDFSFSLDELFNWHKDNINHLYQNHKVWNFSITDDTFIDRPKLQLRFERVR
ncbi:MAG: hypothetical protein OHK0056_29140 [Bacteriovoracaceae bacterium]